MCKKIVFFIRSLDLGGAEVQLSALVNHIHNSNDFSPTIITLYGGGKLEETLRNNGVKIVCIRKKGRWDFFSSTYKLIKVIRDINPDIVHSYLDLANVITALFRPLLRTNKLFWGIRSSRIDLNYYDWGWRFLNYLEHFLSSIPDKIITNSYAGCSDIISAGYPENKIKVVHNGIDTKKFFPKRELGADLRKQWLCNSSGPLIGCIARIDPMKDHNSFILAAKNLIRYYPDARFVCVGKGSEKYKAKLQSFAFSSGVGEHLIWAGEHTDMPAVWNAFDLVTLTSSFGEGFPNSIGESMASGLCCVATDIGDVEKIIDDNTMVVPKKNPEAISEAWIKVLSFSLEQRSRIGNKNRIRIEENFSIDIMVNRTIEIYQQSLNGN